MALGIVCRWGDLWSLCLVFAGERVAESLPFPHRTGDRSRHISSGGDGCGQLTGLAFPEFHRLHLPIGWWRQGEGAVVL